MKTFFKFACLTLLSTSVFSIYIKKGYSGNCPNQDEEVCGTNNVTYQNECFLGKSGQSKAYDGWCINGVNTSSPAGQSTQGGSVANLAKLAGSTASTGGVAVSGNINQAAKSNIAASTGGSHLIITQWWRNPDNGYLPTGENYVGCPCNDSYLPICGSNGMTYANMCRSECANVKAVKYGECGDYNYSWPGPSSCQCDFEIDTYNAVCGHNGRTYESVCVADCANTKSVSSGFCKNGCKCGHYFKPVCGRDGASYDNACKLECKNVSLLHEGICDQNSVDSCFFCKSAPIKRVCGMDKKSYDNECYLKCNRVKKQSDGPCPLQPGEKCLCRDVKLPVCGLDNVTYKNECEMHCTGMSKKANMACYLYEREQNNCKNKCKNSSYNPICGSDGQTYENSCSAGCGSVNVLSTGPCGSAPNSSSCVCSDEPSPVCGVNGRDYLNMCAIQCAGVSIAWEGPCHMNSDQSGALYKTGQISPPPQPQAQQPTQTVQTVQQQAPAAMGPSMMEIQKMINATLAKNVTPQQPTIIVLPSLAQMQHKEPININLQFVNPDGTKTLVENQNVSNISLSKSDFVQSSSSSGNMIQNVRLNMHRQMSLESLFAMISLNPESFYTYFNSMIAKGVVSRTSLMFKGLTLGKLLDYIVATFHVQKKIVFDKMVGSSL